MEKQIITIAFDILETENIPGEEFALIPNTDEYAVSNHGRVVTLKNKKPKLIQPKIMKDYDDGYPRFTYKNKKGMKFESTVSFYVGYIFLNNPEGYCYLRHKNGDKTNNSVDNLEWVRTYEETLVPIVPPAKYAEKKISVTENYPDDLVESVNKRIINLLSTDKVYAKALGKFLRVHGYEETYLILKGKSKILRKDTLQLARFPELQQRKLVRLVTTGKANSLKKALKMQFSNKRLGAKRIL